ncbi:Flp family type IVb pilin [Aureimonas sp. SK2]|uniref:Flp family type IVb pilin n=1 Tax=Aureimonas sp. SK2 TaxID=3015992 RepID=UPI0024438082|nr:Flp family type IVb pilin [Aureimonas sp. SK2]
MIRRFLFDRSASTAIEYGLIGALIGIAILAGLSGTTSSVGGSFQVVMERIGDIISK